MRTGGQLIVDCLEAQGVSHVFCVPGESYLDVLDALYDSSITTITARQEGGAVMMAEAHGKLTGRPGVGLVTRGPGASNAASGVHIAAQDSTPLVLLIGQVERAMLGRDAFQEVDYHQMFGAMAKSVEQVDRADQVPAAISRAFETALAGRNGPAVLVLPEDMLRDQTSHTPGQFVETRETEPQAGGIEQLGALLGACKRPFVILGGSGWDDHAVADMQAFAENWQLPVGCSFRRQRLFDHLHSCYAGDVGIGINPVLATRIKNSDLILLVGGRFSEMPSQGYTLMDVPKPKQTLIHIHAGRQELGRVYTPELAIHATPGAFLRAALALPPPSRPGWRGWAQQAHGEYRAWSDVPPANPGAVQMGDIMGWLRDHLPTDAILTNGAGNYSSWLHRFYRFRGFYTQLAPTSGSMGYGLPAAIAAKLHFPERMVVCFAGDGCFQMSVQEFATAMHYGLAVIVVVINNGILGTIRMHQEQRFPGRVIGTNLTNPDFAALARAYGGFGERVEKTEAFAPAFKRAQAAGVAAILEIRLDEKAISPATSLSALSGL